MSAHRIVFTCEGANGDLSSLTLTIGIEGLNTDLSDIAKTFRALLEPILKNYPQFSLKHTRDFPVPEEPNP